MNRFAVALMLASSIVAGGCAAAEPDDSEDPAASEDALTHRARDAWFYDGPLPALDAAQVTISLKGHTVRVSGLLPAGAAAPGAEHSYIQSKSENGRTRIDVVYPIATGAEYSYNARPGDYDFTRSRPYRPDGQTTSSSGTSFVTWGGFPFIAYAGNIAVHGPITHGSNASGVDAFYLRRGPVSHGCNRMLGEHVTELAHLVGVNMRKVWVADAIYENPSTAKVKLLADYDSRDGKLVDVDYPTDGATPIRPPAESAVMFKSWVGTETPDGSDLPASMKWEAGINGKLYVMKEHAKPNFVCSVPEASIKSLRAFAGKLPGATLPAGFCAKKKCVLDTLKAGGDPAASCSL
jgi:hypothetical protein